MLLKNLQADADLAQAAFCVKDGNGKPASDPPYGGECGLGMDSLTPPALKLRRAKPNTNGRGHAQKSKLFGILLPLLSFLFTGCLSYQEVVLQDVTNIEVVRFDGTGMALRVDAVIENPNGYRIAAKDPDVDLYLNGKFIGKGLLDTALVLDKRSTKTYSIPLHAEFKGGSMLGMLIGGALGGDMEFSAKGTVVGKAGLFRKRFPFELTENFDLLGQ